MARVPLNNCDQQPKSVSFVPFSQAKINDALMVHEAIFIDLDYFLSFIHQSFDFPQSTAFQKLPQ